MSCNKVKNALAVMFAAVILIFCLTLAGCRSAGAQIMFSGSDASDKPLRLHILAASDSVYDQGVKLAVRNQVVDYLENVVAYCDTKEEAMIAIEDRLPLIEQLCNSCLKHNGVAYHATAVLETSDFPAISYNGDVYAAGDYDALRIVLGEGTGHNWWCVLFPPLCFVDLATAVDEDAVVAAIAEVDQDNADGEKSYEISWKFTEFFRTRQ